MRRHGTCFEAGTGVQALWVGISMLRHTSAAPAAFLSFRRSGTFSWWAAASLLLLVPATHAEEKSKGVWITVPSPITGSIAGQVRNQADLAAKNGAQVLVFHFQPGEPSKFGDCKELADYLSSRSLEGKLIVAYIDRPLNGHILLPVMSCQEIYMASGASITFDAHARDRSLLDHTTIAAYRTAAEGRGRRGRSLAIPLKLLFPDCAVYELEGDRVLKLQVQQPPLGVEQGDLIRPGELNSARLLAGTEAGAMATFSARELERLGFINRIVESKGMLEVHLNAALPENPGAILVDPRAALILVNAQLDRGTIDMLKRKVERAIRTDRVNYVILKLDNVDGPSNTAGVAYDFAQFLIKEAKEHGVQTVAYIPGSANGSAVFLAFACDQIIMGPEAAIDTESLIHAAKNRPLEESEREEIQRQLMDIAEKKNYPTALARGLVDVNVEIVRAREKPDPKKGQTSGTMFFVKAEVPRDWELVPPNPVKPANQALKIEAKRKGDPQLGKSDAIDWGIARTVLSTKDNSALFAELKIPESNVTIMKQDWLDGLVFFLRHEVTTVFLVIIGFTCLILELKSPGLTFPGVTAAVCFLLVFWAHSWMAGEVNTLAVLLFLLGLVLIGVEIFLLPGFGITGVSGIVMMLLGLTLIVIRQWPQSQAEYVALGTQFSLFAGSLIVSVVGAFMLARYLPHIPFANRLMLPPPDELDMEAGGALALAVSPTLLGALGTAVTPLAPTGKACFGEQYIDVTTEGGYVDAGSRIQVIEIDGLRVVVKLL